MEIVFNGHDNVVKLRVIAYQDGTRTPVNFSAVTSMRLEVPSLGTNITSGFSWNSAGEVTITGLGQAGLPVGEYPVNLIAFDADHPLGQILVHENSGKLVLKVLA
ncbi:hypothetical protein KC887_02060 [Candidatus Kaiserbacteria bacterium]|nr:hypothetical protein [Candidatus Kaiserbacteria bacterium]